MKVARRTIFIFRHYVLNITSFYLFLFFFCFSRSNQALWARALWPGPKTLWKWTPTTKPPNSLVQDRYTWIHPAIHPFLIKSPAVLWQLQQVILAVVDIIRNLVVVQLQEQQQQSKTDHRLQHQARLPRRLQLLRRRPQKSLQTALRLSAASAASQKRSAVPVLEPEVVKETNTLEVVVEATADTHINLTKANPSLVQSPQQLLQWDLLDALRHQVKIEFLFNQ